MGSQEGSVLFRIFESSIVLMIEAIIALHTLSFSLNRCRFGEEAYSKPKLKTAIRTSLTLSFKERCQMTMIGKRA